MCLLEPGYQILTFLPQTLIPGIHRDVARHSRAEQEQHLIGRWRQERICRHQIAELRSSGDAFVSYPLNPHSFQILPSVVAPPYVGIRPLANLLRHNRAGERKVVPAVDRVVIQQFRLRQTVQHRAHLPFRRAIQRQFLRGHPASDVG